MLSPHITTIPRQVPSTAFVEKKAKFFVSRGFWTKLALALPRDLALLKLAKRYVEYMMQLFRTVWTEFKLLLVLDDNVKSSCRNQYF